MTVLYGPDTFTGSNNTCLPTHDAGWVRHSGHWASDCVAGGGAYGPRIYNNQLGLDYYEGTFYRDEDPPSADYAIEFDYYTTAAGSFYPALRIDESALTYYAFDVRTWSNSVIRKRVAGTWTELSGGYTQFSTSTWYHFRFEAEGTALRVYVDGSGTPLVNITDASISAAGHGGFYQSGITYPAALVDNFLLETLGAGGSIFDESLEESATLGETYLGNVIYPISFTESVGLGDSNQVFNITSTTITEVGGLQDSIAVIHTLGALLNESATLTDSNTVLTNFNPTLTEQTVLQDNNDVLTIFNTTITDSLTGIDDYTGLVVFSATITETLTDPDSYIANVSVVINESISGTDSYSVTINYVTTLNETASAVDLISTSWVCNTTLSEVQTLVDSITAYIAGEEHTVNLRSFITKLLPINSKITTTITKNSKL